MTEPTREIVRSGAGAGALSPYEPGTPEQAMEMARWIATSGLLGKVPPRAETVLFLMARGHELGFSTAQSLSAFHVIDGVPTLKADAKVALCLQRRDVCEFLRCTESTEDHATWATKRVGGQEETHTYRLADAEAAGLLRPSSSGKPSSWETRPKTMLRWRAATELIAMVYPDLVLGLYTPEEQAEIAEIEGRVINVDPDTGEVIGDDPAAVRARATRDQVKQDLRDVVAGDGDRVAERHAAEDAAAAPSPLAAEASEPVGTPSTPPNDGAEDRHPVAPEDSHREEVAAAVEAMPPAERMRLFASVEPPISHQSPATIRARLSDELVEKLHAALRAADEPGA